jgi:hypothetical protein
MEKEAPDKGGELVILCAPRQHFHTLKREVCSNYDKSSYQAGAFLVASYIVSRYVSSLY